MQITFTVSEVTSYLDEPQGMLRAFETIWAPPRHIKLDSTRKVIIPRRIKQRVIRESKFTVVIPFPGTVSLAPLGPPLGPPLWAVASARRARVNILVNITQ